MLATVAQQHHAGQLLSGERPGGILDRRADRGLFARGQPLPGLKLWQLTCCRRQFPGLPVEDPGADLKASTAVADLINLISVSSLAAKEQLA